MGLRHRPVLEKATVTPKVIDTAAVTTVTLNWLDIIAGPLAKLSVILTFVWAVFRIYEMETVQILLPNRFRLPRFRDVSSK